MGAKNSWVLLPETGGIEAKEVAERMRIAIIISPFYIDDIDVQITMTFGVAECTTNLGINECIDLADKGAISRGKKNGMRSGDTTRSHLNLHCRKENNNMNLS
jgi:PleD family two-component response regulator